MFRTKYVIIFQKRVFIVYNIEEYRTIIREKLSDYRFYHSLCVCESAMVLAERFGADVHKAEVAGILHDVMKESSPQEQLDVIAKANMHITDFEKSQLKFYHQISGSAYAKAILGIDDEEILNAIRYHTTGRDNMSLLEQVIYLADFISADRDYQDVDIMRQQVEKGRRAGMLYATEFTIKSVVDKENMLHPDTVAAYNWLIKNENI